MQLSEENRKIFLLSLHEEIHNASRSNAELIYEGRTSEILNYPPNSELNENEKEALSTLKGNGELRSALYKILAGNSADVLFNLLNIIDGTSEPAKGSDGWTEVMLVDKPAEMDEDAEFLHDAFYESYWEWKNAGM